MTTDQKTSKPVAMRISRERKEQISQYATAATCLYGVILIDEFVELFNRYEEAHTTLEEASSVLERFSKNEDAAYSLLVGVLTGPELQPCFEDYLENVKAIRASQIGKPRYLPDKAEFLKYIDFGYREPEKPYADLKKYILTHKLTTRGEGIDGVDGDLLDLHEFLRFGITFSEAFDYFALRGYEFKNEKMVNGFAKLLMSVNNNTRMYNNGGHTPNEIAEHFERKKSNFLPEKTIKVERNAPCPCGSGLKYKKCHGKS